MTRKEADALISYIEFLAALTEDYELMNRPPILSATSNDGENWKPSNVFLGVKPSPIMGMDFGTENPSVAVQSWRDQFIRWHIEEAGPIDPEVFAKLKTAHKRRGQDVTLGALLNIVANAPNSMLDYYRKEDIIAFGKVVRDLTRLEIEFSASPKVEYVDEGAGKEHKAVVLWPKLSEEYVYLPKDYKL
jgi:hypothetical protein